MRRDSNDKEWLETKEKVKQRDKKDRMLKVVTVQEMMLLRKNGGHWLNQLDPAHINPVGRYPEWCYDPQNIVLLNHYSHSNLDSCRDPITGRQISAEERDAWWLRIIKGDKEQYEYLKEHGMLLFEEEQNV